MRTGSWKLIGAGLLAVAGTVAAWRAYAPRAPRAAERSESGAAASPPRPTGVFSLAVQPEFETRVTEENYSEVASLVRARAAASASASGEISGLGVVAVETLLAAVEEQAAIYLGGSWARHWAFLQRTKAGYRMIEQAQEGAAREKLLKELESFWVGTCSGIARHPISLEEVTLRPRFIAGRPIRQTDDNFAMTTAVAPERWPLVAGDPAANSLTVVELMIPIFYARPPEVQGAYFAVWFVWDAAHKDWKIHQLRMYSPIGRGGFISPCY